jgi:hypothetical protein
MSTHPKDVVAVVDPAFTLNEAALKQVAVLFSRIAQPSLSGLINLTAPLQQENITGHVARLAEAGVLFEPDIKPSKDQGFKHQMLKDLDELYKPVGVSGEEFLASRKDEKKAREIKNKVRDLDMSGGDPLRMFSIMQRMAVNLTRFVAIELRNLHQMDAHPIVPAEFSSFEQDDEHPNKQDVLKITVAALPLPDKDVSWEQILEYRNDLNSLNRFLDLRNWINETARGEFSFSEVQQRLGSVLKRFRKQMEFHRFKTVTAAFEAFVTTNSDNLFSFHGSTSLIGASCSVEQRQLALFKNESPAEGGVIAYVLDAESLLSSDQGRHVNA